MTEKSGSPKPFPKRVDYLLASEYIDALEAWHSELVAWLKDEKLQRTLYAMMSIYMGNSEYQKGFSAGYATALEKVLEAVEK